MFVYCDENVYLIEITNLTLNTCVCVFQDSEKAGDVQVRDFLGCISSESVQNNNNISVLQKENLGNSLDIDLFNKRFVSPNPLVGILAILVAKDCTSSSKISEEITL